MSCKNPLNREQQELVEKNWLLIYGGMRKYWKKHYNLDKDEMKAMFGLCLCKAAQTYNSEKSKFSTWAYIWFYKGFMDLAFDRDRRGIVGKRECKPTYINIDGHTGKKNGSNFDLDVMQVNSYQGRERTRSQERLNDLHDLQAAYQHRRKRLSQRQAEVIESRMAGDTLKEIGDRYGISKERVRQVELQAIRLLRR